MGSAGPVWWAIAEAADLALELKGGRLALGVEHCSVGLLAASHSPNDM